MNHILDYLDADGIKRRSLVPNKNVDPDDGIRLSLDVDRIFEDTPIAFRRRLIEELFNVGLVQAEDFTPIAAHEKIRAALLAAIKADTQSIIAFAKRELEK